MPRNNAYKSGLGALPLTRKGLADFIAAEQKKLTFLQYFQSTLLLFTAAILSVATAVILAIFFYAAPIHFSKRGWVQIRNLTPVVTVKTHVDGSLEQVFIKPGQLVQKGALLGAVQTGSIKLDDKETQRKFALKVIELHCLVSLQSNKSVFKLSYDAQILVDKMAGQFDVSYRIKQCERELLRNAMADQSLEESIAALEDQSRLLQNIVKRSGLIKRSDGSNPNIILETIDGAEFPFEQTPATISNTEEDQYRTLVQFAQARQELQTARKEYFQRKLQKEEDLGIAVVLATQEIRYLDKKLHELNKQLDNNFIYASITGTVVGANIAKAGTYYEKFESVFELQPIENEFQISIVLDEGDINKFKTGTPSTITLDKTPKNKGPLSATTVAVLRKPNGTLEAVLDLDGNSKRNADIILASGYHGEGVQRLPANITTGQDKIWKSISDLVLKEPATGSL